MAYVFSNLFVCKFAQLKRVLTFKTKYCLKKKIPKIIHGIRRVRKKTRLPAPQGARLIIPPNWRRNRLSSSSSTPRSRRPSAAAAPTDTVVPVDSPPSPLPVPSPVIMPSSHSESPRDIIVRSRGGAPTIITLGDAGASLAAPVLTTPGGSEAYGSRTSTPSFRRESLLSQTYREDDPGGSMSISILGDGELRAAAIRKRKRSLMQKLCEGRS